MNDKSVTKVVCRIFTLISYIAIACGAYIEPELADSVITDKIGNHVQLIIIVLAGILILFMIVSLIVKYKIADRSKVNVYRVVDVLARIFFTLPATLLLNLYVGNWLAASDIVSFAS